MSIKTTDRSEQSSARKERIDKLLVERGLAETRQKAQALIMAGQVLVAGRPAEKPGQMAERSAEITLKERLRYVSRGGLKLEAALAEFQIDARDKVCADLGASTGGFTDCLLQAGARRVYAIDVGKGQLDWRLARDARVALVEEVNVRYLGPEHIPEPVDIITADLSFISLTKVLPALKEFLVAKGREADLLLLVKPQFELEKGEVGRGGVVSDPAKQRRAVERVARAAREQGFEVLGFIPSPIAGAKGNREFFLHLKFRS